MRTEFTLESLRKDVMLSCVMTVCDNPKGIVQFSHGMAEHKERYLPLMEYLSKRGYICIINDHRGHGQSVTSEEQLGFFGTDEEGIAIVEDTAVVTDYVKERYPGLPVTLFGHSMGALVARCYLQQHDGNIDKLILSGAPCSNPATKTAIALTKTVQFLKGDFYRSPLLQSLSTGTYDKKVKGLYKNNWLSANVKNVIAYNEDPLCGFAFTVNGYLNLFHLLRNCYTKKRYQVQNPSLPILMIAGEKDPVTGGTNAFIAQKVFLQETGYPDVDQKLYAGLRHEILMEDNKEEIYEDIVKFMEK